MERRFQLSVLTPYFHPHVT